MCQNWENILIPPSTSMAETIEVIDKGSLQLALVVDTKRKLLGIVTDGDIRRALIRHQSMDCLISDVMHKTPIMAQAGTSRSKLLNLMNKNGLLAIPIVDKGILVGLETLQKIVSRSHHDNPVFLMAGGFGTRLKPLTDNCPKPLLKLGGKPILETILENFISSGFHHFYISTHYMPEKIQDYFGDGSQWGVDIQYIHEEQPLGTGGALGLLPDDMPDLPIIMMNGDLLTKVDLEHLLSYHKEQNGIATMCVTEYEYQVPYGVVQTNDHQVVSMVEKPTNKFFVNAGIYVITPDLIRKVVKNQVVDMPTLISEQIENGDKVSVFPIHEYWRDIGKWNDYNQAQIDVENDF
jgi:dTDP-glucose pyrophosphorylase